MRIQLISDIHLDFDRDKGVKFVKSLDPEGIDVLVIAGDVCELNCHNVRPFDILDAKYPHIVYILGNHEYYRWNFRDTLRNFKEIGDTYENFHCLENETIDIDGVKFSGCTMWFSYTECNRLFEKNMYDFTAIHYFRTEVYGRNRESLAFLAAQDADVVVTHHLPSYRSVHPKYAGEPTNLFFLCNVDEIVKNSGAKYWLHGHTHTPADYMLGDTNVICNPRGYPGEVPGPYLPRIIEIS